MIPNRVEGLTRLHCALQLSGVLLLLWTVFAAVNALLYQFSLNVNDYVVASFVIGTAAVVEFLTRDSKFRHLAGLSKQQLAAVSHRQTLFSLASVFGTMVMLKDDGLSRIFLGAFFSVYFIWILWSNQFGYRLLHRALYRDQGKGLARTLLIGSPVAIERFCSQERPLTPPGTEILGYVAVGADGGALQLTLPMVGTLEDLRSVCERTKTRALLMLGLHDRKDLVRPVTEISTELGLRTMWIDDISEQFGSGFRPSHADRFSVVSQLREPLEDPMNRCFKRLVDLVGSSIGIVLLLPPAILFVAILHRLFSRGPLFYRQQRSGRNGENFSLLKFRSMTATPEVGTERFEQARENDARVFRGGDLIRKFSIDELPQLINVFTGDMSLVGPRPHPLPLDERLAKQSPTYRLRHLAKPGITGLAQSRGWRGETRSSSQVRNRIRLDLLYIRSWSLSLDLRILVETVVHVIKPPKSAM